jgi:hypothetical protein
MSLMVIAAGIPLSDCAGAPQVLAATFHFVFIGCF